MTDQDLKTPPPDLSRMARAAGIKPNQPYCLGDVANLVEEMAMDAANGKMLQRQFDELQAAARNVLALGVPDYGSAFIELEKAAHPLIKVDLSALPEERRLELLEGEWPPGPDA